MRLKFGGAARLILTADKIDQAESEDPTCTQLPRLAKLAEVFASERHQTTLGFILSALLLLGGTSMRLRDRKSIKRTDMLASNYYEHFKFKALGVGLQDFKH